MDRKHEHVAKGGANLAGQWDRPAYVDQRDLSLQAMSLVSTSSRGTAASIDQVWE